MQTRVRHNCNLTTRTGLLAAKLFAICASVLTKTECAKKHTHNTICVSLWCQRQWAQPHTDLVSASKYVRSCVLCAHSKAAAERCHLDLPLCEMQHTSSTSLAGLPVAQNDTTTDGQHQLATSAAARSTPVCVCVFYSATLYGIHFGPASHIEAESTNGTFNPREWVNILSDTAEWRWFSWRDDVYLRAKTQHWVTWTVSSESNFHYRYVSSEERSACVCSHDCSSSPWNVSPLIDRNARNTRATLINYSSILV